MVCAVNVRLRGTPLAKPVEVTEGASVGSFLAGLGLDSGFDVLLAGGNRILRHDEVLTDCLASNRGKPEALEVSRAADLG